MRLLVVGELSCPAIRLGLKQLGASALCVFEPTLATAMQRLICGEAFDATLLLAPRPHAVPSKTSATLSEAGQTGEVLTVAGPWFEGRMRFQDSVGDTSVVYWRDLASRLMAILLPSTPSSSLRTPGVVLVSSRDRDAAEAIADALAPQRIAVAWCGRGGRRAFLSRCDVGIWIGGQLNGPATWELAQFCAELRAHGAPVVTLLDFPRHDELLTAKAVGAEAVLAKPYSIDSLLCTLQQLCVQTTDSKLELAKAA